MCFCKWYERSITSYNVRSQRIQHGRQLERTSRTTVEARSVYEHYRDVVSGCAWNAAVLVV